MRGQRAKASILQAVVAGGKQAVSKCASLPLDSIFEKEPVIAVHSTAGLVRSKIAVVHARVAQSVERYALTWWPGVRAPSGRA